MKKRDLVKEWEVIFRRVDQKVKKYCPLSDKEINRIIHEVRKKRATTRTGMKVSKIRSTTG